ncbi:MAG: hypothetical protein HY796_04235 [Elusimicrobia bacterium]|nr:hypothetical protein [Elusimicrobiota bacterium]
MKAILKISVFSTALLFSSLTFYSVPIGCEAAVTPVRIVQQIAVYFAPQNCEASVIEQLCSSVTGFLDDEANKAGASLKGCKANCGWKKRKNDLIDAARKKAKESCARGEAPDINDINKGLDGNAKERLKSLYDRNNRMFDGSAKLAAKDFDVKSSQSPASTGKGGQVSDLKSSEPDIKKITSPSEFSLASESTTLLASAKTVSAATPKASAQAASYIFWCSCPQDDTGTLFETTDYSDCVKQCCEKYHGGADCPSDDGDGTGSSLLDKLKAAWKKLQDSAKALKDRASDKYHELKGDAKCAKAWYNPKKTCCLKGTTIGECPKCLGGKNWNEVAKRCECPKGAIETSGKCDCPKCSPEQVCTIAIKCEPEKGETGRSLTPDEMEMAKKIFGDKIKDYNEIKIVTGTNMSLWGKITLAMSGLKKKGEGKTEGTTIYFPNDATGNSTYDPKTDIHTLMHEMTHVYQNQTCGRKCDNQGRWESLQDDLGLINKYGYDASDTKKPFNTFTIEGQAMMVEDYAAFLLWEQQGGSLSNYNAVYQQKLKNIGIILGNAGLLK